MRARKIWPRKAWAYLVSKMADETAETATQEKPSCTFFKKSKNRRNVRKRQAENSDSDEGESSVVVRKEKKLNSSNPMIQKTVGLKDKKEEIRVEYESSRSAMSSGPTDLGATATYELDTDFDRDAQAVYAKSLEVNKERKEQEGDDKVYRGVNNYMQYYEKKDTALGNAASGMVR